MPCLTPLHMASVNGYATVAELLLSHGADPNSRDWKDLSPYAGRSISIERMSPKSCAAYGTRE